MANRKAVPTTDTSSRSATTRPTVSLAAKLRPGNVHSAEDWDELLLPEIERQLAQTGHLSADAAFAKPEMKHKLRDPHSGQ